MALGAQDAPAAAKWLLELARKEEGTAGARRFGMNEYRDAAYRTIWRNGRAAELGLCDRGGELAVADLAKTAPGGEIGTADPVIFGEVAADGGWTLLCQAREDTDGDGTIDVKLGHHGEAIGDRVSPYLVVGSGPGMRADDLVGADPTGRFVALRQGPCLSLVDTRRETAVTLQNADLRDDGGIFGTHRAASFDAGGQRMLYLRGSPSGDRLVVRTLATGREVEIEPGPGLLWRARIDPDGRWVVADFVDGPEWPIVQSTLSARTCRGAATSYGVFGTKRSTSVTRRCGSADGGPMQAVPGLIRPFGGGMLVRDDHGSLVTIDRAGSRAILVPADCRGTVVDVDRAGRGVLVVCDPPRGDIGNLMLYDRTAAPVLINPTHIPVRDTWTGDIAGMAHWMDEWVDVGQRRAVRQPPPKPKEVRATKSWDERRKGIYARRSDKTELRGAAEEHRTLLQSVPARTAQMGLAVSQPGRNAGNCRPGHARL